MAAAMAFTPMADLAHAIEDLLHVWREGRLTPTPQILERLTRASDLLSAQVDAVAARRDLPDGEEIARSIRALLPDGRDGSRSPAPSAAKASMPSPAPADDPRPRLLVDIALRPGTPLPGARAIVILKRLEEHGRLVETTPSPQVLAIGHFSGRLRVVLASHIVADRLTSIVGDLPDVATCHVTPALAQDDGSPEAERRQEARRSLPDRRDAPAQEPAPKALETRPAANGDGDAPARPEAISSIRVPTERMDHLLDGIGELILDRERLQRLIDPEPGSREAEVLEGLGRTVDLLRDEVMTMRLLPFSSIVPRLERAVRDLAARLGKE